MKNMNAFDIVAMWRGDRNPELRGYTGRIFEREVLGECRIRARGYVSFRSALGAVFRNQPGSPYEPMGEAGHFHGVVADSMKVRGFNSSRLKLYTAIGSALDRFHGIDGFFYFEGAIVTVDATMNPHKDVSRARVIVTAEDAFSQFGEYGQAAHEIAGWFDHARIHGWKGVI
ncbi:MAG: hypothetical protein KGI49_00315 [Patescibacteria group bacterium]|nr:hypothetical protein [Patescibacteria group bacterium]